MGTATEEKKETVYDSTKVDDIISKAGVKKELGYIDASIADKTEKMTLAANCNTAPKLISTLDNNLWNQKWKERAFQLGVDIYAYFTSKGKSAFLQTLYSDKGVDYCKVERCVKGMAKLIEEHYDSVQNYNKKIAEPFISERKTIIDKL